MRTPPAAINQTIGAVSSTFVITLRALPPIRPLLPKGAAFLDFVHYYDFTDEQNPVKKYLAFVLLQNGNTHMVDLKEAAATDEALAECRWRCGGRMAIGRFRVSQMPALAARCDGRRCQ